MTRKWLRFRIIPVALVLALVITVLSSGSVIATGASDSPVQITKTGCPNAQHCSSGGYPTESGFLLPYTQQKVFQNPRPSSHHDYYVFYSTNVSIAGSGCSSGGSTTNMCNECVYSYSPDGVRWVVNQTIGNSLAGVGDYYTNCSAAYASDPATGQLLVYLVVARNSASANISHNIELVMGTVADSSDAVSWGPVQIVSASSLTQNFQFPVAQVDSNGYLQIAYSWVDTSTGRQTVDLCSSRVAYPISNSSFACNGGANNSLFNAQVRAGQAEASFMPQLQPVPGHSVLVVQGPCSNIATSACVAASSLVENATLVDWNGVTQSFTRTSTFTYPPSSSSDRRSSTIDRGTGTFYLVYKNGTDLNFWIRNLASPYTSWSTPSRVAANGGEGRVSLLAGSGTAGSLVFMEATDQVTSVSGGGGSGTCGTCPSLEMFVNSTVQGTAWTSTTLYSNTTWAAAWVDLPWSVDTTTNNRLPMIWEQHVCGVGTNVTCTSQPQELWFNSHLLYVTKLTGSFTVNPSNPLVVLPVTFTGSASGGLQPYSFSWNFGDGSTGNGQTVSHSYLLPGQYTVTLTITDASGQSFLTSQTITVSLL